MLIRDEMISLRRLEPRDATERYVSWLNSKEVNQYTESRFAVHTIASTRAFIEDVTNEHNYAFAIIDNASGLHVGNIKIGSIDPRYRNADLGLIIGERDFWGKGIATQAIEMCVDFGFDSLGLHRLWAGVYAPNVGSSKAFLKAGFELEGTKRECVLLNDEWIDCHIYGKINRR